MGGNSAKGRVLKQLIDCYRSDPESDFLKLKYHVRKNHDAELNRLIEKHGGTKLPDIRFRTLTAWYRGSSSHFNSSWSCRRAWTRAFPHEIGE